MELSEAKPVQAHKSVKNLVSKQCARDIWTLLTGTPHSTQELFTSLLTIASAEEAALPSAIVRNRLKSTVAAVWECTRYGWQQTCFGRPAEPRATLGEIKCRRTRVLMLRAVNCGHRIARRQSEAP